MKLLSKKAALLLTVAVVFSLFAALSSSASATQSPVTPQTGFYGDVNSTTRIAEAIADTRPRTIMDVSDTIFSTTGLALSGTRDFTINFNGNSLVFHPAGPGITLSDNVTLRLNGGVDSTGMRLTGSKLYIMGAGLSTTGTNTRIEHVKDDFGNNTVEVILLTGGWHEIDGNNYYFVDGVMQTGWIQDRGAWFYCEPAAKGTVSSRTGRVYPYGARWEGEWLAHTNGKWYFFHSVATADGENPHRPADAKVRYGEMASEYWLLNNDGHWYYFNTNGDMAENKWIKSRYEPTYWYYVDANGRMMSHNRVVNGKRESGWFKQGNIWYFFKENGRMAANEFVTITTGTFRFNSNGAMLSDQWFQEKAGTPWYYFKTTGHMAISEWVQWRGKWYYFNANGHMLSNTEQYIKNGYFRFAGNGAMLDAQWYRERPGTPWFYYKVNGRKAINEWVRVNNAWYFFDTEGRMQTGMQKVRTGNNTTQEAYYGFTGSGAMMASQWWKNPSTGIWYYFKQNGRRAENEWLSYRNNWYFFTPDGEMIANRSHLAPNGKYYFFNSSGAMVRNKWQDEGGGNQFFYGEDGARITSRWHFDGTYWNYIGSDGNKYRNGEYLIGGKYYYFNANGVMLSNGERQDPVTGQIYFYGSNGAKVINNWVSRGSNWYFYGENGARLNDEWLVHNGNRYYFGSNGVMYRGGSFIINGVTYSFDLSGRLVL